MEVKIAKVFPIFVVFQLSFAKTQAEDIPSNVDCLDILFYSNCHLNMTKESARLINGNLSNPKTTFVRLNPIVRPYYSDEFWRTENSSDEIGKYFWVWADDDTGRQYLHLEYNFVEMSLWTLSPGVEKINIDLHEVQEGCWVTLNVTEQFCTLASLFLETIHEMSRTQHRLQDSVICYTKADLYNLVGTAYKPSSYQCSDISNATNLNFSLEDTGTRLMNFNALKYTIECIAVFLLPLFSVLFYPEILTARCSQKLQANMKNFEINSSKAQTPLSELFSPGNRMSAVLAMCIIIYPVANIAFFYQYSIDMIYYKDYTKNYTIALPFICLLLALYILTSLYSAMLPVIEFEECKQKIDSSANIRFNNMRGILRLQSKTQNIDCTISSYLGEYISLENNMRKSLLGAIDLLKDLKEDIRSRLKPKNAPLSLLRLLGGLLVITVGTAPIATAVFGGSIPVPSNADNKLPQYLTWTVNTLAAITMLCFVASASIWLSIVTMTLAGTVINYDIILPYIILALSIFYYVCHPFFALQENYLVLKDIVFKECSSHGPKYMKHVPVNTDCSGSSAIPHNNVAPLEDVRQSEGSSLSRKASVNPNHTADDNATNSSPSPTPEQNIEQNFQQSTEEEIGDAENVQATGSRQLPFPEQDNEQTVLLYKSDDSGWESIPKALWVSIYKKLLPLDECIAKAGVTSVAAVLIATFLMLAFVDFRDVSKLQLSGQAITSFITASIPKLVLSFINSEGRKQVLKRTWEVTVRETVNKYIKDNEISSEINEE